jgi:hypothetical protein
VFLEGRAIICGGIKRGRIMKKRVVTGVLGGLVGFAAWGAFGYARMTPFYLYPFTSAFLYIICAVGAFMSIRFLFTAFADQWLK